MSALGSWVNREPREHHERGAAFDGGASSIAFRGLVFNRGYGIGILLFFYFHDKL
jgi:hypothetical protein